MFLSPLLKCTDSNSLDYPHITNATNSGATDEAQGKGAGTVEMLMPVVAWDESQYGGPDLAVATTTTVKASSVLSPLTDELAAADLLAATVFTSLTSNGGSGMNLNGDSAGVGQAVQQEDLPMLMQSLFAALHAEFGDGADPK